MKETALVASTTQNNYGRFSNDGSSYEITNPITPRPWENYLYSLDGKFQTIVDQRAFGATFYNCPEVNRVCDGRNFLLTDQVSGQCWSLNAGEAPNEAESNCCTHRLGSSEFRSGRCGIESSLTIALGLKEPYLEVNRLSIRNQSAKSRKLALVACQFINLKGMDNKLECQRTRALTSGDGLVAERRHYRTPKHMHAAFYKASQKAESFCGSLQDLKSGAANWSQAATGFGKPLPNTNAYGTEPVFALRFAIELAPGEKAEVDFLMGISQEISEAESIAESMQVRSTVDVILQSVAEDAEALVAECDLCSPDPELNTMLNGWTMSQLRRQTVSARATPWFNWRNHLQDAWAYLPFDSRWLPVWIARTAGAQKADGFVPRCSARVPGLSFPDQTHADIGTWLALCAARYYHETGDRDIFFRAPETENGAEPASPTILKAIIRGLEWLFSHKGPNEMVLMRDGDWSDPLEEVGKKGIGESPWTSMALVNAVAHFAPVLRQLSQKVTAEQLETKAEKLTEAIRKSAWDGEWFIRAITDDGTRLSTSADKDGRISLLMQSWAIISGVADAEQREAILKIVEQENRSNSVGPILYAPPFLTPRPEIGRETAKPAGTCVNGACYSHVAIMWAMAEAIAGRPDESLKVIQQILPFRDPDACETTKAVPLWIPNYYHGPHSPREGEASDVMTSAAPPWIYLVVMEHLLGIQAEVAGLRIAPNLPSAWNKCRIRRNFRGSSYQLYYERSDQYESTTLLLDGKKLDGNLIPPGAQGSQHKVTIYFK